VLIVAFGVLIYFLSLRDAWLNGKKRDEGVALNSVRKQYQMLLSDGFPYLMITPGFILLVFVVIFPILFGFAIAFTNYNLYHTPPAKLVDWVGLKNFVNIFTLSIWRSTFLGCAAVDGGVDAAGDHPAMYRGRAAGDSGEPERSAL
jgi:arabinogalactan oligomer/maltooligosaccharide transport system permease protein